MNSDLMQARAILVSGGVEFRAETNKIRELSKMDPPFIHVDIAEDGYKIREISDEVRNNRCRLQLNDACTLPVIRCVPIFVGEEGEPEKDGDKIVEMLSKAKPSGILHKTTCSKFADAVTNVNKRLPQELQRNSQLEPLFLVGDALQAWIPDPVRLGRLLTDITKFRFDNMPPKKRSKIAEPFYVCFDVLAHHDRGVSSVYAQSVWNEVRRQLTEEKGEGGPFIDVFGNRFGGEEQQIGKIKTEAGFILRPYNRNPGTPCFHPYHLKSTKACQLSPKSASDIVTTAMYLFRKEHKGVYYSSFGVFADKEKTKKKGEFVFVAVAPHKEVQEVISDQLGISRVEWLPSDLGEKTPEEQAALAEEKIKKASRDVVKVFQGLEGKVDSHSSVSIFTFFCPDGGQGATKLKASMDMTVSRLAHHAEMWQSGGRNYSANGNPYGIKVIDGESSHRTWRSHSVKTFYEKINKEWTRVAAVNGKKVQLSERMEFQFVPFEDVIKLYCGDDGVVESCIRILASNHIYLLIDMVNRHHNLQPLYMVGPRRDVLAIPSMISSLLFKKGLDENKYRLHPAFLVGSMMGYLSSAQRELWKYKDEDRKNQELLGTKYVYTALEHPVFAINHALRHAQNYLREAKSLRWKEQYQNGQNRFYSLWALSEIARNLDVKSLPDRWTPFERVLFAFGYLLSVGSYLQGKKGDDSED